MSLFIHGLGLTYTGCATLATAAGKLPAAHRWAQKAARLTPPDPALLAPLDATAKLAMAAAHEALAMAAESADVDGERTGLIFVSAWGTIDATVAYLDSMLEAGGRYASPRHFSRSVYSSVPSLLAIGLKIRGPCETLAFDAQYVSRALDRADALLATHRADRVLVCWADQTAPIAEDLAARAARHLHRPEYARYARGTGQGAAAVLASHRAGTASVGAEPVGAEPVGAESVAGSARPASEALEAWPVPPFPTDAAVRFALAAISAPAYFREEAGREAERWWRLWLP